MKIDRKWAMPNKWTFIIKPIGQLLAEEVGSGMLIEGKWIDPFAGKHSPAQLTNDLNPEMPTDYHLDALEFLRQQPDEGLDGCLFDPPYSFRQVSECYKGFGHKVTGQTTQMKFYSDLKNEMARIIKPGGKVISFGWNTNGLGKSRGFKMDRILIVAHGGHRNDTLVTVETKVNQTIEGREK